MINAPRTSLFACVLACVQCFSRRWAMNIASHLPEMTCIPVRRNAIVSTNCCCTAEPLPFCQSMLTQYLILTCGLLFDDAYSKAALSPASLEDLRWWRPMLQKPLVRRARGHSAATSSLLSRMTMEQGPEALVNLRTAPQACGWAPGANYPSSVPPTFET